MNINTEQIVPITEAKQNFSHVTELADKNGKVIIFKDGKPRYVLITFDSATTFEMTDEEKIDFVAARILKRYRHAFEELAKG